MIAIVHTAVVIPICQGHHITPTLSIGSQYNIFSGDAAYHEIAKAERTIEQGKEGSFTANLG